MITSTHIYVTKYIIFTSYFSLWIRVNCFPTKIKRFKNRNVHIILITMNFYYHVYVIVDGSALLVNILAWLFLTIQCKAVIKLNSEAIPGFRQWIVSLRHSLNNMYSACTIMFAIVNDYLQISYTSIRVIESWKVNNCIMSPSTVITTAHACKLVGRQTVLWTWFRVKY